jgi:glucose 1-dehydrogenase
VARSAVVTGSSSGIGRAIAVRLAADGFWVLLADIRRDPVTGGEPTDDLIRASGGACEYLTADVSDRQDCDGLVARAAAKAGRLDVLVNNAALAGRHSRPLLGTEDGDFDAIMAVNLRGPFMLCRAAVRQMLTQEPRGDARGRIVNITSQHGMDGTPGDLSQSETTAAYVRSRTPFARFGEPEDVAAAVGFLASDEATYISGATLMVDGGWMAY